MKYFILLTLTWIFSVSHGENECKIYNEYELDINCDPDDIIKPLYIIKDQSVGCENEETLREKIKTIGIAGCPFNNLNLFKNCTSLAMSRLLESYSVTKETLIEMDQLTHIAIKSSTVAVHASAFSRLPNLRKVDFENNNLNLSELAFQGAHQLKHLLLYDVNSISTLPSGFFRDLNDLEVLMLGTSLTNLADIDFTGLEKLKFLSVERMRVKNWTGNSFHILRNLKYLILGGCELGDIDFSQLTNLIFLTLGDVYRIEQLNASVFSGLTNLRTLILTTNDINRIEDGAFSNLKNLKKLDLSRNKLTAVDEHTFKGLDNLQYLCLKLNSISAINANTFTALTKLVQLDLSNQRDQLKTLDLNAFPQFIDLEKKAVIYTTISLPDDFEKAESQRFKQIWSFEVKSSETSENDLCRAFFGNFRLNQNQDQQMDLNNLTHHMTDE